MTTVIIAYQTMSSQRKNSPIVRPVSSPSRNDKPFTSFLIKDILKKNNSSNDHSVPTLEFLKHKLCPIPNRGLDSVWVAGEGLLLPRPRPVNRAVVTAATAAFINDAKKSDQQTTVLLGKDSPDAPLTALEQLTTKTFTGLETSILKAAEAAASGGKRDSLHLLSRQAPRKKRKSRTAFTNHQIFELERRFLYQKYLTPADRDELASTLGLTNAQVITWFQNRRAKLKRDIDELKADLSTKDPSDAEIRGLGAVKRKAGQNEKQHMRMKLEKLQLSQKCALDANLPPPLVATEDTRRQLELRDAEFKIDETTRDAAGGSESDASDSEELIVEEEMRSCDDEFQSLNSERDPLVEHVDRINTVIVDQHVEESSIVIDEQFQHSPQRRSKSC